MTQKILVCDVDGVVVDVSHDWAEYIRHIVPDVNVTYKLLSPYYDFHIPVRGYVSKEEVYHFWKRDNLYDKAEPLPGSVEMIKTLKYEFGFDIVFASHVEGNHAKSKFDFLKRHFPVDGFMATREKGFVRATAAIDDRVEHLISHPENVIKILKHTPHAQSELEQVQQFKPDITLHNWDYSFVEQLMSEING